MSILRVRDRGGGGRKRVRAVILNQDRRVVFADVPAPTPRETEVLLKPHFIGICGTDLHAPELAVFTPPVIMGHEFAGVISWVGSEVTGWHVGDRVVIQPNANVCGVCEFCRLGQYHMCYRAIWEESLGARRDGGMAELAALAPPYLYRLPDDVTMEQGALIEPLACAVRAVRRSGISVGDAAAVIGAGPLGLLVLKVLLAAGVGSVAVIQRSEFRRMAAERIGATTVLAPEAASAVFSAGDLEHPRWVFECSGGAGAVRLGIDIVKNGGTVVLMGAGSEPAGFDQYPLLAKECTLLPSFIYADEYPFAIRMVEAGDVDPSDLITSVLPLDRIDEALAAVASPKDSIKVLLHP
jgi:threonine dehydrogenase-like Zn-dependent dehydrogenase